jgi:hypothetical protein
MYSQHALSNHIRLSDSYFATSHSQLYLSHCRDITGDLLHAEPPTECNAQSRLQPLFQGLTLTSVRCQSHPHKAKLHLDTSRHGRIT